MAVVSNNAYRDIEQITKVTGIFDAFELIQGNDQDNLRKKPWPDTYLRAAERLGIDISGLRGNRRFYDWDRSWLEVGGI